MPIKIKSGHWYETRNMDVVKYERKNDSPTAAIYPHLVGGKTYTDTGRHYADGYPDDFDIVKDHGTTDPRPRKAPTKKVRKVRMWFLEYNSPAHGKVLYSYNIKCTAIAERDARGPRCGPIFSQIIEVPLQKKKA